MYDINYLYSECVTSIWLELFALFLHHDTIVTHLQTGDVITVNSYRIHAGKMIFVIIHNIFQPLLSKGHILFNLYIINVRVPDKLQDKSFKVQ